MSGPPSGSSSASSPGPDRPAVRVGQGFDVHAFSDDPARVLVLGGVVFDERAGLVGHSDADVVAHACADALLGRGRPGRHRPALPRHRPALARRRQHRCCWPRSPGWCAAPGWQPGNVDCARRAASAPKLAPHARRDAAPPDRAVGAPVTVKGNRAEGLGALGRGEGIACFAVAVVESSRTGAGRVGRAPVAPAAAAEGRGPQPSGTSRRSPPAARPTSRGRSPRRGRAKAADHRGPRSGRAGSAAARREKARSRQGKPRRRRREGDRVGPPSTPRPVGAQGRPARHARRRRLAPRLDRALGPAQPSAKGLGGEQVEGRQAVRELLLAGRRKVREVWVAADQDDAGCSTTSPSWP